MRQKIKVHTILIFLLLSFFYPAMIVSINLPPESINHPNLRLSSNFDPIDLLGDYFSESIFPESSEGENKVCPYELNLGRHFQECFCNTTLSVKFGEVKPQDLLSTDSLSYPRIEPFRLKKLHYKYNAADFWFKGLKAGLTIQF